MAAEVLGFKPVAPPITGMAISAALTAASRLVIMVEDWQPAISKLAIRRMVKKVRIPFIPLGVTGASLRVDTAGARSGGWFRSRAPAPPTGRLVPRWNARSNRTIHQTAESE